MANFRLIFILSISLFSLAYAKRNSSDNNNLSVNESDVECVCVFSGKHAPVCGSDGNTYPNTDALEHEVKCNEKQIEILYDGECKSNGRHKDKPIDDVASDEKVVVKINTDFLKDKEVAKTLKTLIETCNVEEECVDEDDSTPKKKPSNKDDYDCSALLTYHPVCGTDGITYSSPHVMNLINRCDGSSVKVARKGRCLPNRSSGRRCTHTERL